ncbi:ectoine/hydroxyectoine ABC transporter permease subunit EhuC [Streptomyces sp. R302]|uniref:ectoine/hydroxyectoine ABC transporter permease subunit EhuC n=1 Tax=unclassified Streptomyces TaxID=2593676 RepID=UPI00145DD381|nr:MULTISPECIES: ectoine/hydroxyectoine ABC transporter permease subunit EhuC [unclassified Streptomyces]NML55299.1 ectoine/hydroxyectoine ABC transporter permease subunit EhuC [Streptomyces sp. R301]NML82719.1 ectoine/hydroxyectoine ABC transporter permease subunit EhuC [Streptomyces sp. R302]
MAVFLSELGRALPAIGQGLLVTLEATALGAALALLVAFALGLASRSRFLVVRGATRVTVEFLRGTSLYVQLFWLFFALPMLGFRLEPMACGVLAFGLNYGAYGAEVVRGAIAAVPAAQTEAAIALGMGPGLRLRRIVLPQAYPLMVPPFKNLLIQLLKATPLLSLVTVADLTFTIDQLRSATGGTAAAYLLLLLLYFALAALLGAGMDALERRAKARLGVTGGGA